MSLSPEPDDVDFIVAESDSDPESRRLTGERIRTLKSRPQHAADVLEARRILDALKINLKDSGNPDPAGLLENGRRSAVELARAATPPSPEGDGH